MLEIELEEKKGEMDDSCVRLLIKDDDKRLVYGIVYEPEVVDTQGDFANADEIEKAAHRFMEYYQEIGEAHFVTSKDIKIVECYVAPIDFNAKEAGFTQANGEMIRKGSWVLVVKIYNDTVWEAVKSGELTGFSFEGTAREVS